MGNRSLRGSGEPSDLIDNSFFNTSLLSAFKSSGTAEVASYSRLPPSLSFRSAETGNWYLDNWPNSALDNNPNIKLTDDQFCPASPREIEYAKRYVEAIGGVVVLTQVPSKFSCARRVDGIASALAVAALIVDAEQFSSPDGGGHLDRASARKYSALFFSWLERLPEFRQLFPN